MPIVTLLTDFGTADGYTGEIKGVVLSAAPAAMLVDISHDIPAQDVELGRLTLARYWRRFPPGTVHLAIVDPGSVPAARLSQSAVTVGSWWAPTMASCRLRCWCRMRAWSSCP